MGSPKRRAIFDFGPKYLAIITKKIQIKLYDASEDGSHCAAAA
jgi:hypothetical protein